MTPKSQTTTPPDAPEETVAGASPEEPEKPSTSEAVNPADLAPDQGNCDNHPDRTAIAVADFKWVNGVQRFCNQCLPNHYRFLL